MNDATVLRIIREIAKDTSRIFIVKHARQRMRERKISMSQVYMCIRKGHIVEPAHLTIHGARSNVPCSIAAQEIKLIFPSLLNVKKMAII
ncbi:MAG: DUF4258 domain-containing protein [Advenella sp.]